MQFQIPSESAVFTTIDKTYSVYLFYVRATTAYAMKNVKRILPV